MARKTPTDLEKVKKYQVQLLKESGQPEDAEYVRKMSASDFWKLVISTWDKEEIDYLIDGVEEWDGKSRIL